VSEDEVPNKLKQNVNTVHILTLMVAFEDGSINDTSPLKWDYNKTRGVPPAPASNRHWTWCSWVNRCLQEIGAGKGQHTYVWAMGSCHRIPRLILL